MSKPAWTIKGILEWSSDYLERSGSDSARLDAQLLLGHVLELNKVQLYVQYDRPLMNRELEPYRALLKRRANGEPVAYILGEREFYGRPFQVDRRVLVPRPETEHLVDAVLAHIKAAEIDAPRIVDVGTGSGALAITLACELPQAIVLGIDQQAEALEVAALNADRNEVRERVKLSQGDVLTPIRSEASVDVIVSNPPYLDDALMQSLPRDVRDFEPHTALHGGPDGLDIHRRLHTQALRVLRPGGLLAVEVAGDTQAQALRALWEQGGGLQTIEIREDYAGIPRIVLGTRGDT
jgi:release factor glutamine methyltransferase